MKYNIYIIIYEIYNTFTCCRLVNVFVYFGFSLISVTLAGNKYLNFILIAVVEIPAYVTMWIGMEYCKVGRRSALQLTCFFASMPCLIYLFVPAGKQN